MRVEHSNLRDPLRRGFCVCIRHWTLGARPLRPDSPEDFRWLSVELRARESFRSWTFVLVCLPISFSRRPSSLIAASLPMAGALL